MLRNIINIHLKNQDIKKVETSFVFEENNNYSTVTPCRKFKI